VSSMQQRLEAAEATVKQVKRDSRKAKKEDSTLREAIKSMEKRAEEEGGIPVHFDAVRFVH
jgi:signal transduction histidine kinase